MPSDQTAVPRLRDPVELAALQLRKEQAIAHAGEFPPEQRPSLLAAVVWPQAELLEWSLQQARAKLEHGLGT